MKLWVQVVAITLGVVGWGVAASALIMGALALGGWLAAGLAFLFVQVGTLRLWFEVFP